MAVLLSDIRQEYLKKELSPQTCVDHAVEQFKLWLNEALTAEVPEPTAMHIATVSASGCPSGRVVLLKAIEHGEFHFYTNYASRKGQHLAHQPWTALTFFWPELERQVRIEGKARKLPSDASDAYFQSRPYASQLSAWASAQSQELPCKQTLDERLAWYRAQYPTVIPRPPYWGGYGVSPHVIEFWQGRPSRLHDRVAYTLLADGGWRKARLAP